LVRENAPRTERVSTAVTGTRGTNVADEKAQKILAALGGRDNIVEIEPCITRLRCELEDGSVVDEKALKALGAHGVMRSGNVVQVVVGPEADTIASDIEDLL
jgi:N-acetylglucosamine PTS system EIIB component